MHVFVFQRIIYILIKDGSPSLSQAKKLKYFLRNEAICLLICCLFFVQYSLSSIAFPEATVIVCNYAGTYFSKKTNVLKASWKPHTFFLLFFLKRYTILACVLTSPSPLRAGNSAIRYGFYTLDRTVKIFICLSLNVLLKSFICKVYSFYYIDTSVLLENIPLIKFIKTTYGTRVVYFP